MKKSLSFFSNFAKEKAEQIDRIEKTYKWNRFIVRGEIIKLYMEIMGVKDNIQAANLIDLYELESNHYYKNSLFAIVTIDGNSKKLKKEVRLSSKTKKKLDEMKETISHLKNFYLFFLRPVTASKSE